MGMVLHEEIIFKNRLKQMNILFNALYIKYLNSPTIVLPIHHT